MSVSLLFGSFVIYSGAEKIDNADTIQPSQAYKNEYPIVFVHGLFGWGQYEGINGMLPYWGATTGDLCDYLTSEGWECYSASVGPLSSAWDRACELYAQLTGTTVDYGEAHSKQHGHHRYGRTYSNPFFEGWGSDKKVHLIGHSFGGTTVRMLMYLLTNGDENEVAAAGDSVSPLFTGGKEDYVQSVTTICTPHNNVPTYYLTKRTGIWNNAILIHAFVVSLIGRSPLNGTVVDYHLEQFGLTNIPGKNNAERYLKAVKNFLKNTDDTCQYDLGPEGNKKLNDMLDISKNTYYFSYAYSATHKGLFGTYVPDRTINPLLFLISLWIGLHPTFKDKVTGTVYNEEWRDNDGLASTIAETYPFDEASTQFNEEDINRGVWNVMPIQKGDHGQAIGLYEKDEKTHSFYLNLLDMLNSLDKD